MATTKNSSNSAAKSDPNRPFAAAVLSRARAAALTYRVVIWFDREEGEYYGRGAELPLAMGDGKTPDACVRSVRRAMEAVLAVMMERGEELPSPLSDSERTEQVNIRLTPQERFLLESAAQSGGFRGVSDYVRSRVLAAR